MSSLCRTINRSRSRQAWPESKLLRMKLFAATWQQAKKEQAIARKNGLPMHYKAGFSSYCNSIVEKWLKQHRKKTDQ